MWGRGWMCPAVAMCRIAQLSHATRDPNGTLTGGLSPNQGNAPRRRFDDVRNNASVSSVKANGATALDQQMRDGDLWPSRTFKRGASSLQARPLRGDLPVRETSSCQLKPCERQNGHRQDTLSMASPRPHVITTRWHHRRALPSAKDDEDQSVDCPLRRKVFFPFAWRRHRVH